MSLLLKFVRPQNAITRLCSSGVNLSIQPNATDSSSTGDGVKKTVPRNVLEANQTAHLQAENGAIYDKRPFKIQLEGNKVYSWCLCGKSRTQPFCDGTHKDIFLKIKLRPIRFMVEKTGNYWVCQCKQTKNRPFCDGTHKLPHIQEKK